MHKMVIEGWIVSYVDNNGYAEGEVFINTKTVTGALTIFNDKIRPQLIEEEVKREIEDEDNDHSEKEIKAVAVAGYIVDHIHKADNKVIWSEYLCWAEAGTDKRPKE